MLDLRTYLYDLDRLHVVESPRLANAERPVHVLLRLVQPQPSIPARCNLTKGSVSPPESAPASAPVMRGAALSSRLTLNSPARIKNRGLTPLLPGIGSNVCTWPMWDSLAAGSERGGGQLEAPARSQLPEAAGLTGLAGRGSEEGGDDGSGVVCWGRLGHAGLVEGVGVGVRTEGLDGAVGDRVLATLHGRGARPERPTRSRHSKRYIPRVASHLA